MKVESIALATVIALSLVPAASAEGLHERNVAWLTHGLDSAGVAFTGWEVGFVADLYTSRGVELAGYKNHVTPPLPPDLSSTHVGEAWVQCFGWFRPCEWASKLPAIDANVACYIGTGDFPRIYGTEYLKVDFSGPEWDLLTWTEGYAGLPVRYPGWTGTGIGSMCLAADFGWFTLMFGYAAWVGG